MFRKKFSPDAKELIKKLHPDIKGPLRNLTDQIASNPFLGKPLQEELEGFYSAQYQRYRIIYSIDANKKEVVIEFLGHRESIYDIFSRFNRRVKH